MQRITGDKDGDLMTIGHDRINLGASGDEVPPGPGEGQLEAVDAVAKGELGAGVAAEGAIPHAELIVASDRDKHQVEWGDCESLHMERIIGEGIGGIGREISDIGRQWRGGFIVAHEAVDLPTISEHPIETEKGSEYGSQHTPTMPSLGTLDHTTKVGGL